MQPHTFMLIIFSLIFVTYLLCVCVCVCTHKCACACLGVYMWVQEAAAVRSIRSPWSWSSLAIANLCILLLLKSTVSLTAEPSLQPDIESLHLYHKAGQKKRHLYEELLHSGDQEHWWNDWLDKRNDTHYSGELKTDQEISFLSITVSSVQGKVNTSTDTKEKIFFSYGKRRCVFHVLLVFHYWVKKQLSRWEIAPWKQKVKRICLNICLRILKSEY